MSLRVSIEVDEPARTGGRLAAVVVIEASAPREIDGVTLALTGRSILWRAGEAGEQTFLRETARLHQASRLEAGTHRLRCSFPLPGDLPPSCAGGDLGVRYLLHANVEVPWWFDPRAEREITIALPPPAERPAPRRATAFQQAPGKNGLFLELALDDTVWAPGETITGAFSLGNVAGARLDGATVAIVPQPGAVSAALPGEQSVFTSLVDAGEGTAIPFALPVPVQTPPSFPSRIGTVSRAVQVRIDGQAVTCAIPILIDAFDPRPGDAHADAEPVGASRWRRAWRDEGTRFGLALDRRALRLHGELAGGDVSVTVQPQGHGLAAILRWAGLDLGLTVEPRGLFPRSGVDLFQVSPLFSARFVVRGHDGAQLRVAFHADLCAALSDFSTVVVDDEGATVTLEVPARDPIALRRFLEALDALAAAVAAAERRLHGDRSRGPYR